MILDSCIARTMSRRLVIVRTSYRYLSKEIDENVKPLSESKSSVFGTTYYKYQTTQANSSTGDREEKIRVSKIYADRSSWKKFTHECKRYRDLFIHYKRKYYYAIMYVIIFIVSHYAFVYSQKSKYGQDFPVTNFELYQQKANNTISPKYLALERRVDQVKEIRREQGPYV